MLVHCISWGLKRTGAEMKGNNGPGRGEMLAVKCMGQTFKMDLLKRQVLPFILYIYIFHSKFFLYIYILFIFLFLPFIFRSPRCGGVGSTRVGGRATPHVGPALVFQQTAPVKHVKNDRARWNFPEFLKANPSLKPVAANFFLTAA